MRRISKTQVLVLSLTVVVAFGAFIFFLASDKPEQITSGPQTRHTLEQTIIGSSVEERDIGAYTFTANGKNDPIHLVFVGGIHGGYEWNSVLLAYQVLDYLELHPDFLPEDITVSIIPSANPDGLYDVIGKEGRFTLADVPAETENGQGRFNANAVDLNRNFDCKWKEESKWRGNTVSAGSAPFSEPEAAALRDFILGTSADAVVFWHSQSNAVYASECEEGILASTSNIMNAYAHAAGYPAVDSFDSYEITGDAEGWLASIGIPSITVELATHETTEFEKNLAGVESLLGYYVGK